ncbi:MAG: hypothetical protein ABR600_06280 [Actinomycetota bacterium]
MLRKLLLIGTTLAIVAMGFVSGSAGAANAPGLTYSGARSAATGTTATYSATLADGAGVAIAGADVAFQVANQPAVHATTDATGVASTTQEILKAAGQYLLAVTSAGQPDVTVRFAVTPAQFDLHDVLAANGGGEPSISSSPDGTLYTSGLSTGTTLLRSSDNGETWVKPKTVPFASSGDSTVGTDSQGNVYLTNLGGSGANELQVFLYRSGNHGDGPWTLGQGPANAGNSSNSPLLVDRQWVDSYTPATPGAQTRVYMTYHDWAPSQIWVNASTDGGAHFGIPQDVITSPQAQAASFCSTIPGGIKAVQSGPKAGRVYVAWLAADPLNPATGCNETQAQNFHTLWVAWSDNADAQVPTWTDQLVFDGGISNDGSTIFADLTVDSAGNPYIAFDMPLLHEWDSFVEASFDGGLTWNGRSDGTGTPYRVNNDTGSHYYAAIAAGDPGRVAVVYLRTPTLVPTLPNGKPKPGGDPNALWKVYVAESLDLNLGSPTWTVADVKTKPMHKGDICTFGIACVGTLGADRSLLDFIDIAVSPDGTFHASYADNFQNSLQLRVVNEAGGPSAYAAH